MNQVIENNNESIEYFADYLMMVTTRSEGPLGRELNQVLKSLYGNCLISLREAVLEILRESEKTLSAFVDCVDIWVSEKLNYSLI